MTTKRTIIKWALFWPVCISKTNEDTYWAFCEFYFEDQEYEEWNDWQEGVGDHWRTSWRTSWICKRQYKNKK